MPGRAIRAKEVLEDIKAGMSDSALMEKYRLSSTGLEDLYRQLAAASLLTGIRPPARKRTKGTRRSFRHPVDFVLPVYAEDQPQVLGTVLDLTENGIGTRGIRARVNDLKTLVIPADEFFDVGRLRFFAHCRWVAQDPSDSEHLAGFEIAELSCDDALELEKLIELTDSIYCQEADESDDSDESESEHESESVYEHAYEYEAEPEFEAKAEAEDEFEFEYETEEPATAAESRRLARHTVPFQIPIHDAIRRENRGKLIDITEKGFAVDGMTCEQGQKITLVIPAYHHGRQQFDSIVLIAQCRWVKQKESGGCLCGFKITEQTTKNSRELQRLVQACVEG
jgi:hypothetical protein